MAFKMGILIIHGMGSQKSSFADPMIRELKKRIKKEGSDPDQISFRPVHWAPKLIKKEEDLWKNVSKSDELDWVKIRKFIINSFGDAVAYNQRKPNEIYDKVHKRIHDELVAMRKDDFKNHDKPLVLMGHSLGSHILSNYVWDREKGYDPNEFGSKPLERMETLTGIITFGCCIPLFTLALSDIESIKFPNEKLDENLKKAAKWLNFYDPDDALGYPLRGLSSSYEKAVKKDIRINVGDILTQWNLASHQRYWTDNDFTKPVSKFLCDILSVLESM